MTAGDVSGAIRDSYEALPYRGGPHYGGHVDCLATVATLYGLDPAPIGGARVLELGCAAGGNLLPMALGLPDAEFVGVDLSPRQIEAARRTAGAAGLGNVRLLARDLLELDVEAGGFDYVICHGLYSWVPGEVRRRILSLCEEALSPRGVAMVSFNAYPGSQTRDSVRALLRFALERVLAPDSDPIEATRALLRMVPRGLEGAGGAFVAQFRRVAGIVGDEPGWYLAHEFLAPVNRPFFLWEFAGDAEDAGLRFLGDAWAHPDGQALPPGARDLVGKLSPDRVAREQWLDLLEDRTFRRALLVRPDAEPSDALLPDRVLDLHASAGAWPLDPGDPAADEEGPDALTLGSRTHRVSTNVPVLQAAFRALNEAWPEVVPVDELWRRSRDEARAAGAPPDAPDDREFFATSLLRCYVRHVVGLHVGPFRAAARAGERPVGSPVARAQVEEGAEEGAEAGAEEAGTDGAVTNLLHQHVSLSPFARSVLRLLDGTRDRADVVRTLSSPEGTAGAGAEGAPDGGRAALEERVERTVAALARQGLVMDDGGGWGDRGDEPDGTDGIDRAERPGPEA